MISIVLLFHSFSGAQACACCVSNDTKLVDYVKYIALVS